MGDGSIQLAAEGSGKKVATQEITRNDGAVVELQQVVPSDPETGRPLDAPPWDMLIALQRAIVVELRVLTTLFADETRSPNRQVGELRAFHEEQLR